MNNPLIRIAIIIVAGALFTIASSWYVQRDLNHQLQMQINEVNLRFIQMSEEHDRAVQAANEAICARNEIYEITGKKSADMEKALANTPDFGSAAIPDELRRLIRESGSADKNAAFPASKGAIKRNGNADTK